MCYFDLISGLGESSCSIVATYCNDTQFWDKYPDSCLSFVFCCLSIDDNQTLYFMFDGGHNGNMFEIF